jgi:hypothetical protein
MTLTQSQNETITDALMTEDIRKVRKQLASMGTEVPLTNVSLWRIVTCQTEHEHTKACPASHFIAGVAKVDRMEFVFFNELLQST